MQPFQHDFIYYRTIKRSITTQLTLLQCYTSLIVDFSEIFADFQTFGDGGVDACVYLLRSAVIKVLGSDGEEFAKSPQCAYSLDVRSGSLDRVACADIHATCGDVEDLLAAAESLEICAVVLESDVEQGHVLNENLQDGRETHVPERSSNH